MIGGVASMSLKTHKRHVMYDLTSSTLKTISITNAEKNCSQMGWGGKLAVSMPPHEYISAEKIVSKHSSSSQNP